jgi:uridine kinase
MSNLNRIITRLRPSKTPPAEPPAHDAAASDLQQVVSRIHQDLTDNGPGCVVAIDGHGGAGKSTFAKRLAERVQELGVTCTMIHSDDFYASVPERERASWDAQTGYERSYDWQRLRDQVLVPLRDGQVGRSHLHDWDHDRLSGETTEYVPATVIIVEGCYSARPELRDVIDVFVYVEADDAERRRRLIERGENTLAQMVRWEAAESWYLRNIQPAPGSLRVRGD